MSQKYLLLSLLLASQLLLAQKNIFKIPDSLQDKSYEYLDEKTYEFKKDSSKAAVYLFTYLHKAKNEKNWKELVSAYQNILHESPRQLRFIYADSMIFAAKKSLDNAVIGSAYLSKGIVYYGQKKQNLALDNYIIANNYISKTNDKYLIYKVKYHIALIKYYLGFYDEAISLLKDCVVYYKDENPRPYLNSLHSLAMCFNRIGNYGLCSQTNNLGLAESKRLNIKETEPFFIHSEGINDYYKQNYASAIKNLKSSMPKFEEDKDFANESIGNFYIGKSYWELKMQDKAIPYFQKVDQNFNDKGYIRADIRQVYELIISYYKKKNNPKLQLYYIDQLLKADAILNETSRYLIAKIHKEYDTKELLREREKILKQISERKNYISILVGAIIILLISLSLVIYRFFKNKTVYKQKFEELMVKVNDQNKNKSKPKSASPEILDINQEAVADILKQLEKFEKDKKFLEKDISLAKLAVAFNSNTKYLSKVIMHYKEKGFVDYINDLKIDYIISLLYTDKKARNYTNKALAEEAGFSSTQRFTFAFQSRTGISPTYYIGELKKK